jgi:hypothetical protein
MQTEYKNFTNQELISIAIQKTNLIKDYYIDLASITAEVASRLDPNAPVQLELF